MRTLAILLALCSVSFAARPQRAKEIHLVPARRVSAANVAAEEVLGPYAKNLFRVEIKRGSATFYGACISLSSAQQEELSEAMNRISGSRRFVRGVDFQKGAGSFLRKQSYKARSERR